MDKRASLTAVLAWIEANAAPLGAVTVARTDAAGRVAGADIAAPGPLPPADAAARDGIALRAAESVGASAYNPLAFPLIEDGALPQGGAMRVAAGAPLPGGADSVVALDQVEIVGARATLVEPIEPGSLVDRAGAHLAAGTPLVRRGDRLTARALGALAAAGIAEIAVIERPRVRLVLTRVDGDHAMLAALVARDGGVIESVAATGRGRAAIADALAAPGADLALVIGGTGPGADDHAAGALADAGTLAIHGVAIRPGDTAGVGRLAGGAPAVLLPGTPTASLWAYELIAGPAVRRRGGRPIGLPYESRRMVTAKKIVSGIGMVDACPIVCIGDDRVEPIAGFDEAGLGAALRADGVVLVPEGSEGHARDTEVLVYLFDA